MEIAYHQNETSKQSLPNTSKCCGNMLFAVILHVKWPVMENITL